MPSTVCGHDLVKSVGQGGNAVHLLQKPLRLCPCPAHLPSTVVVAWVHLRICRLVMAGLRAR